MNLTEHVKEIERKYQNGQEIFRRQSVKFLLERISQLESAQKSAQTEKGEWARLADSVFPKRRR
jgi:hypothetical protein